MPLAVKGTEIFLQLKDFVSLNHMYAFSLQEYTHVFKKNLDSSNSNMVDKNDTKELITSLEKGLFKMTFTRFGFCMFKKDKLAFALHLIKKVPDSCSD